MRGNRTGLRVGRGTEIAGALLLYAVAARAIVVDPPFWCAADCNGDGSVAINEIIACVNIALGAAPAAACPACDGDGDGFIGINELVSAVATAIGPGCLGEGPLPCGDGSVDGDETCDDGNRLGGDGCASNCTVESARSGAVELQPLVSALPQVQQGRVVLRTGQGRGAAVGAVAGGDLPVTLRADELRFEPAHIPGLACICLRALPLDGLGAGVAGVGAIHCGTDGGTDLEYRIVQDHNTTPDDPHNREVGTPDDPECNDVAPGPVGTAWHACREGSADSCPGWDDATAHPHLGVCNGPRVLTRFGGAAPRGSAEIAVHLATTVLTDGGTCATTRPMRDGACLYEDYGPDCLPCTDDDAPAQISSDVILLTSGTAEGTVFDRDDNPPRARVAANPIGGCFPFPCRAEPSAPFDCDALAAMPGAGLQGGALAFADPELDTTLGDIVSKGVLSFH